VQVSDVRTRERHYMFWNAVVKTINISMVSRECNSENAVAWNLCRPPGLRPLPPFRGADRRHSPAALPTPQVFGVPPMVLFAVLVPYELWHTDSSSENVYINPQTAFTMLSLFNILRFPLVVLPKAMRCVSEAMRATGGLEKFLAEPVAPRQDLEGKPGAQLSKVGHSPRLGEGRGGAAARRRARPPLCFSLPRQRLLLARPAAACR
jgi:hypothetical protein